MLFQVIKSVQGLDQSAMNSTRRRLDALTKPKGSLGRLEDLAVRLAGIAGGLPLPGRKVVIVMAADHGVAVEGVSAYPQEVTGQMLHNFLSGGAAINVLARNAGADVIVVDMGIAGSPVNSGGLYNCRVRAGSGNMVVEPAMSRQEAVQAVEAGINIVQREYGRGMRATALGEMGIGNTTASAAILTVLAGIDAAAAVGPGTGVSGAVWEKKLDVVRRAVTFHRPNANDPLDVLSKVGGLEIAGLAGVILGAAAHRLPVVLDGFVSTAAAMLAVSMAPACKDYMFASHLSAEPGHSQMLRWLGLDPVVHLGMRLGEGTGAVLFFTLMDAAVRVVREMATFDRAGVAGEIL